jgi:SAM-dependent methyltransferase
MRSTLSKPNRQPICYVCGNPAGSYRRYVDDDYSIIKCDKCGLEYTDPTPTEATLTAFYAQYQDIRADRRIVGLNAQEHLKMLGKKCGWTPESTVLDFGSGSGVFVELAGEKCYGIDLQPSDNSRIKKSLDELPSQMLDFITLWGVLEHLPQPKQVIGKLASLLHGGGVIALTTVDAEGVIPYYYKPPEHLTYWTREAFEILCDTWGLEIVWYQPYQMSQLGSIYFERLLSRTPNEYHQLIINKLPDIVNVPTNEIFVLMRRKSVAKY